MDLLVISGLSKSGGSQFSLKAESLLSTNGSIMTYNNLRKEFGLSVVSEFEDYNTPYLGGFFLYNYLIRRGFDCKLINFLDLQFDEFKNHLQENPNVIVLSTTFLTNIHAVKEVTRKIRDHYPDGLLVAGGPLVYTSYLLYEKRNTDYNTAACRQDYFFLNNEEYYHEDIDVFVVEEKGENTLVQLVGAVKNGADFSNISNIAFYNNNRLTLTARCPEGSQLIDDHVVWDDVPDDYLFPIFPMRGSQGCPYKCKYCNFAQYRTFQRKSPEKIAHEFTALSNTGKVKMVRFTDDNLFFDRKHLEECCRRIVESGVKMKWTAFIRANSITEQNIELIKKSGCVLAQIGMESGDLSVLTAMNKKSTPDDYIRAIKLLNTHGISTQLYFIVGFPGETEKSIDNTIKMINSFQHDGPAINELMVFPFLFVPLSPVYDPKVAAQYNLRGYMNNWSHNTMNSDQARAYARRFLDDCPNVYPHYGIEEFILVDMTELKQISSMRRLLFSAERQKTNDGEVEQIWRKLERVVAKESNTTYTIRQVPGQTLLH